ncbi:MAG: hypothetical protein H0V17_06095 [Deltaproteobacteria bacterium]|nr:hypothetical protein [Deltaproteobacteria bacterium]
MHHFSSTRLRDDNTPIVPMVFDSPPSKLARGTGPVMTPRPPRQVATPSAMPSMRELSALATNLAMAQTFAAGANQLQRDLCKLLHVTDALCLWIDWPRRTVWNATGQVSGQLSELVTDVAGCGKRETLGSTLLQPIGPRPARAVLALRRPSGSTFDVSELAMIATLAAGIAPALDRLMR